MQNLRLVLIIIGILIVVSLLVHGLWLNRKERSSFTSHLLDDFKDNKLDDHYSNSEDGIVGKIRVLSPEEAGVTKPHTSKISMARSRFSIPQQRDFFETLSPHTVAHSATVTKNSTVQSASCANETVTMSADDVMQCQTEASITKNAVDFHKTTHSLLEDSDLIIKEEIPLVDSSEVSMDANRKIDGKLDTPESQVQLQSSLQNVASSAPIQPKLIVLHVGALSGQLISGQQLLASFNEIGLLFGERNIFYRYLEIDSEQKSPAPTILFRVVNMLKPGELIPKEMGNFTTPGIVLFMTLPCPIEIQRGFDIMLQTAQRIADSVGGVVLDDECSLLSASKIQAYRQMIRILSDK